MASKDNSSKEKSGSCKKSSATAGASQSDQLTFEEGGRFVDLPGAVKGEVVVRFPPEASGYLHIGHAKAALLNQYYKQQFDGKLILRFDDTNPEKETAEFEEGIFQDLEKLGVKYDKKSRTSDYFDLIQKYCEQLISEGHAYVDDTDLETMRRERDQRIESKCRNLTSAENLKLWEEMKRGTERGLQCCVRLRIDMKSANGCMRDPVIYRCKLEPHVATGDKYKVYPTYDFACPIVDSVEGVTHALRTSEYHDRDEQYFWVLDKLALRRPHIYEYSRLNLQNTVLSKRKLTHLVKERVVDGWDDPRFPTVRGIVRRGLTVDALRQFIIAQGSSRSVVTMEWDKIWAYNKKIIDPIVKRYTALVKKDIVKLKLELLNEDGTRAPVPIERKFVAAHPKNASLGERPVWYSGEVLLEQEDAKVLKEGQVVTLINWGNVKVERLHVNADGSVASAEGVVQPLSGQKDFKSTLKFSWLAEVPNEPLAQVAAITYDNVISKAVLAPEDDFKDFINRDSKHVTQMVGDQALKELPSDSMIQILRKGYYRCDSNGAICTLIFIPDGTLAAGAQVGSSSQTSETKQLGSSRPKKQDKPKEQANVKPSSTETPPTASMAAATVPGDEIVAQIRQQGDKIRELKSAKAAKDTLQPEIDRLLKLKLDYKAATGKEWEAEGARQDSKQKAPKSEESKKATQNKPEEGTRLGLEVKREEDFSEWYQQLLLKAEMIEYYDVSGCYVIRPPAYAIWERVHDWFDAEIKKLGVENAYFPLFVTNASLTREKTHIADFAPEVAWVTRAGKSELAEPIAIRPTSETIMYPSYAKWIRSWRDLPLKMNQWNNVVRWEFKHPQPFLRTREFLWQEGHTVYSNKEDALNEVYQILELYARVYEELLAIPVTRGRKTENEKFAGADTTTTVEVYIPGSGRGSQGATSHYLGTNFSRMFEILFENKSGVREYAHQNSWGISTRTIGITVMVHGDNQGLILPPRVANVQVVIIPVGMGATEEVAKVGAKCEEVREKLASAGVRARTDLRDNYTPGWKFNYWELRGVPIRIEIGPRDLKKGEVTLARRDIAGEKGAVPEAQVVERVKELLEKIHHNLYDRAKKALLEFKKQTTSWNEFCDLLNKKYVLLAPFCGDKECENEIKKASSEASAEVVEEGAPSMGAKTLCIPLDQPEPKIGSGNAKAPTHCINPKCSKAPEAWTLFGRSY